MQLKIKYYGFYTPHPRCSKIVADELMNTE